MNKKIVTYFVSPLCLPRKASMKAGKTTKNVKKFFIAGFIIDYLKEQKNRIDVSQLHESFVFEEMILETPCSENSNTNIARESIFQLQILYHWFGL